MARIRVCQLITELAPAGAERCVYELARRLDRGRFDVRVAALRGGAVADWLAREGIPVHVLGVRSRLDARKFAALVRLLRQWRVDLLHTHLFHADLVGRAAAYMAGTPHLVHTVHTVELRWRPWQYAFARLTAGRCERVICVSPSACRAHRRRSGLPRSAYTVIPNGVDAAQFSPDNAQRQRARQQWGIAPDAVLAAYAGRLDYEKGTDVLLAALAQLQARGQGVHAVIAGQGPMRGAVEHFIAAQAGGALGEPGRAPGERGGALGEGGGSPRENGGLPGEGGLARSEGGPTCRYLGFVKDIRPMLWAADLLVMPSRWEGFGLAAAEAMAAGLPVVGTRIPGLCDVVVDAVAGAPEQATGGHLATVAREEATGLLVEPENPVALADAILRLARDGDLRRRLGQAGRARIERLFPLSANIAAHEALYERIAQRG